MVDYRPNFLEERKKMRHSWELYTLGLELRFTSFPEQLLEYLEAIHNPYGEVYKTYIAPMHSAFFNCELLRNVQSFKNLDGIIFYDKYENIYYWFTIEEKETVIGEVLVLKHNKAFLPSQIPINYKDSSYALIPPSDPKIKDLTLKDKSEILEDFFYKQKHSGRNQYYFQKPKAFAISKEKVEKALKEVDKISTAMKIPPAQAKPKLAEKKTLKERVKKAVNDNFLIIFFVAFFLLITVLPLIIIHNVFPQREHAQSHSYEYPEYELIRNAKR